MSSYSERQLLMLSNFVYLPCCLSDMTIKDILNYYRDDNGLFTVENVAKAGTGGGMSSEEVTELFIQMDEEIRRNPEFGELSASRKLNDGYVRAICYTNKNDGEAVVAFRGTGGSSEAWTDNFEGGYQTDTKMQKLAADFLRSECSMYENITVTGHSKGGNLSQYVTVCCPQMVGRCVSFDGQGFNDDFIDNNEAAVKEASKKIKSIAAYNDYVNILLTPIAGEIMYVSNGTSLRDAHSPLSLLVANEYDMNGNITSSQKQSSVSAKLKEITDNLVKVIEPADTDDKAMMSYITGSTIASVMEIKDSESAALTAAGTLGKITAAVVHKLADFGILRVGEKRIVYRMLQIETDMLPSAQNELKSCAAKLIKCRSRIDAVAQKLEYNIAAKIYAEHKLNIIMSNISSQETKIEQLTTTLDMIVARYEERERNILQKLS